VVRIYDKQLDAIAHAMGADPVSRVEAHLRAHYPGQCDLYDPGALRAWIEDALEDVGARAQVSSQELLLSISTRWVLRAWYGEPAARKDASL
jgi:hypothetical protein